MPLFPVPFIILSILICTLAIVFFGLFLEFVAFFFHPTSYHRMLAYAIIPFYMEIPLRSLDLLNQGLASYRRKSDLMYITIVCINKQKLPLKCFL